MEANEALAAELASDYESFRPLFASQQNTLDTSEKRWPCFSSRAAIAVSGMCSWPTSKATSNNHPGGFDQQAAADQPVGRHDKPG